MQTLSHHPRSWLQRAAWVFAASALALTLALGGCAAPHARNGGSPTIQQTQGGSSSATGTSTGASTGATTGSSNSAALQQLQNIDNQNQSDSQQLNSAQNDAGVNYASQENQTQP